MSNLVAIPFHNQILNAAVVDGVPHVAMKPICENIGLQWEAQLKRIKRHPVLNQVMSMMDMTCPGEDGKEYLVEMVMLPLKFLNGWLFGIDVNRVKPEIKDRLIEYQTECFDVLANHFMPGVSAIRQTSEPPTKKTLPGGLTKSHQDEVKTLVRQRADALPENKRAKATISMWSAIKKKWGCTYKEVPDEDFSSVIGLVARMPLDGEVITKGETVLITSTEFDYAHAKGHADNLRHMARATVDDLLADEFIEEINRLEKCLTRAWTEMDEALFRMGHAVTFLKRWRSK